MNPKKLACCAATALLLWGLYCLTEEAQAAEKPPAKPQTDAERLRGPWRGIGQWQYGEEEAADGTGFFVFTDKEVKIPTQVFAYKLDPAKTPKQMDLALAFDEDAWRIEGIYRFEGERLWICMALRSKCPRPDAFETKKGDGRSLVLLERAKPYADGRPPVIPKGFQLADRRLTEELRKKALQTAQLIDAKKYAEFLEEIFSPEELKEMLKREKATLQEHVKQLPAERWPAMASILKALEKKIPLVNETGTQAFFDVRDIHFNGSPPQIALPFRKVDGKWRLSSRKAEPDEGK